MSDTTKKANPWPMIICFSLAAVLLVAIVMIMSNQTYGTGKIKDVPSLGCGYLKHTPDHC